MIAVGGFGRGDLSFLSDLDLLFLYRQRLPLPLKESIRDLTYTLWDNGFELGHVTASVSAVKKLIREDFSVLTTYLETQFIGGDESFCQGWRDAVRDHFGPSVTADSCTVSRPTTRNDCSSTARVPICWSRI